MKMQHVIQGFKNSWLVLFRFALTVFLTLCQIFLPLYILNLLGLLTLHGPINGACLGLMLLGFDGFFQDFIIVVIFLHIVIVF